MIASPRASARNRLNRYSGDVTTVAISGDSTKSGTVQGEQTGLRRLSPEFRLLLACLCWPLGDAEKQRIAGGCHAVAQWPHLLDLAARHRVTGLVWRALQVSRCGVPPEIALRFQQTSASAARQALFLSAESLRVAKLLGDAGTEATFLKGAAVAILAYGDVTVRHAKDIDLLLPEAAVPQALSILRGAGYAPLFDLDAVSPSRQALWFRYAKSMDLRHTASGVLLELHWRMTDLPVPGQPHQPQHPVDIAPGRSLQALPRDELLTYLCLHGAAHGWMRLKWLADVHALLRQDGDVDAAYRRMLQLGGGRSAGQALLLCHDLLDLPISPAHLRTLERDAVLRVLRRSPVHLYLRGGEVAEVDDLPFGTTSVYLSRMLLGNGLRAFLAELRTWAFRPDELLKTRLPRGLFFLFPFVRVGAWTKARLRHGGRSAPQDNG